MRTPRALTLMDAMVRADILDMKLATFSTGFSEMGLLADAGTKMFKRYYSIPAEAGWAIRDWGRSPIRSLAIRR